MSRRRFLQTTAALSASLGLSYKMVGTALAAPVVPATEAQSTLLQTVRQRTVGNIKYRTLVSSAGEPYLPRIDILGRAPAAQRVKARRSIVYLGA